jgi:hypothetical protein
LYPGAESRLASAFFSRMGYFDLAARTFAQRAFAAREIFRRAAALMCRLLLGAEAFAVSDEAPAAMASNLDWSRSICAFKAAMRLSLATERLSIPFMFIRGEF